MFKWLSIILICLSFSLKAQTPQDTLVGLVAFHTRLDGVGEGSSFLILHIKNNSSNADTLTINGKFFTTTLVINSGEEKDYTLPKYEGLMYSSYRSGGNEYGNAFSNYPVTSAESGHLPNVHNDKVVWIQKKPTTSIQYLDSSTWRTHYLYTGSLSTADYKYWHALPMSNLNFGHRFKLNFFKYINYAIIAKEDNTPVDIISRRKHIDTGVWRTYPKERIYLNKGDVYEYLSTVYDGTGTEVIAPSDCKPIAIYQWAGNIGKENWWHNNENSNLNIGCISSNVSNCAGTPATYQSINGSGSMNFTLETPLEKARYEHYIPTKVAGQYNLIEVKALQNNTLVSVGGSGRQRLLNKGETYFDSLSYPCVISSTEPTVCKYYSKFTINSASRFYGDRTTPPGNMGMGIYNRWVQVPGIDIADAQNNYNAFIPLNNTNKMVNMECVLHAKDTLKIDGVAVTPFKNYKFDSFQSISFAMDSGWHNLKANKPFIAYIHYYLYDIPLAKNGVADIYLDSLGSTFSPINGFFDFGLRGDYPCYAFPLTQVTKIYPHSVRVNGTLNRTLRPDTPYFRLCQYSPVQLWGRADFYGSMYHLWVLPNGDSIKQNAISYSFKDTGFFTLKFITGRRDTLCDNTFDWFYDSSFVQVYIYGNPRIYLPKDTMVCKGTLLPIRAKTDGDSTLAWKPSAVFINAQGAISNIAKIDSTFQIIASITYPGCAASEDTMQVSIFDSVKISLPKDTLLCYGSNFAQTGTIKGGDSQNYTYRWSNGDTLKVWQKNITVPSNLSLSVNDGCATYKSKDTLRIAVRPALKLVLGKDKDSLICPNSNLKIIAKASGGIKSQYQYLWQNGTTDSFLQLNTISKDTLIRCILTDNCSSPDTQTLQLRVVQPFVFKNIVYDSLPCPWANIDLKVSYQGGLADSNVLNINTANLANHTYKNQDSIHFVLLAKGQYGVFTFSLSNHCPTLAKDTFVTIYKPAFNLTASINVRDTCCVNTAISGIMSFQSQRGTGSNQYRIWVNGALVKDTTSALTTYSFTLAQSQPGIQAIKITATDGCGTDSFEKTITVLPNLKIVPLPDMLWCANKPYLLNPTTSGGYAAKVTWQAKINQGAFADVTLPSAFNFGQNTQLILAANDYCSNLQTDTITIQIVPKPIVSASVNPLEACVPAAVTLNNPAFNSTVPVPLHWSIAGVNVFNTNHTAAPIYQNLTKAGSYSIRLKSMAADTAACWDTFFTVVVHPQPVADFSFLPKEPEMQGDDVELNFNGKRASQWTWLRNDTFISNYANTTFKPSYVGNYQIKLIAYSDFGCADSITKDILVRDIYRAFVPNAFSPNGDGVNDVWTPSLISVETATLSIYSRWGELLYTQNSITPSWDGKYENQIVPQGNYVYVIFLKTEGKLRETLQGNILLLR